MASKVKDVKIIRHIDDWSDHKPLEVIFNLTLEKLDNNYIMHKQLKANWCESAKKQYYESTRNEFYNAVKPVGLCDETELCGDSSPREIIEKYCGNILVLNKCAI